MPKIRCPVCQGPINRSYFVEVQEIPKRGQYAVFVGECWSGDLDKKRATHIFKYRVKLPKPIEIDQLKQCVDELEKERDYSSLTVPEIHEAIDNLLDAVPKEEAKEFYNALLTDLNHKLSEVFN